MKIQIFFIVFIILAVISCQRYVYKDYNEDKVKALYDLSLVKTGDITKEKPADDLLSVTLDSSELTWKYFSGKPYVLAAMWKSAKDTMYYKNDCTSGYYNTRNRYNFVTIVPELKQLCRQRKFGRATGVNLRIEQLLGLPAGSDKKYFVEVWVQPDDLLRPCRDTEITDRSCGLMKGDTSNQEYKAFLDWLDTGNAGYPFTQLGYTYDWNKHNKRHLGLSEFLIDKQSNIVVKDFIETCDYCYVAKISRQAKGDQK